MTAIKRILSQLWREEDGQDLVEYALLVVLIALGTIAAADRMGDAAARALRVAANAILQR
ncbi:MAG TPA: hypothetical protein VGS20_08450 [Candidatus Acidoferrales bacterium]|nr:hypothetical protein [Candidatus Acidoferrales bacterium]